MQFDTPPGATYRLQFNADFTFMDAVAIVPYLKDLGVTHVYASPIQKARPRSTHGYDIVDHSTINPELGGEEGFDILSAALHQNGLGLLLDIVPNHMGVGGSDSRWWLSVIEWGEQSPFASFFDVDWERSGANRKLVLPFLGKPYGAALRDGELHLRFDEAEGSFSVWHWEHKLPINPLDYRFIMEWAQVAGGADHTMRPLYQVAAQLTELADGPRPVTNEGRINRCERIKNELAEYYRASPQIKTAVDAAVRFVCGDIRMPESFGALHALLQRQSFRIAYWRIASSETNYRRFFDINSLAGIKVEERSVFDATHELVFKLIHKNQIHGLRIDHIDGLADPLRYLMMLRDRLGPEFYIVVEKILEPGEKLQPWPIHGATGYEALRYLDGVFIAEQNEDFFTKLYEDRVDKLKDFKLQIRDAKLELLNTSFRSELETLVSDVQHATKSNLLHIDITSDEIRRAIAEVIAHLPVYRTYIDRLPAGRSDRLLLERAIADAKARTSLDTSVAHDLLESYLLSTQEVVPSPYLQGVLERVVRRLQQLSGPVMAKSLEDTLFYRYGRFVALNEVGGDPSNFGMSVDAFHTFNMERVSRHPLALTASATHDTKRGEDTRARMLALSHRPEIWARLEGAAQNVGRQRSDAPDANDRYILLQSIVAAWPCDLSKGDSSEDENVFQQRIIAYAIKSVRESKRRSSWTAPQEAYETGLKRWIKALFEAKEFRTRISAELPLLADAAYKITLSRLVLKLTMPGVPDIYQGCEFEDLSLVDPDNRRPVNYKERERGLRSAPDSKNKLKLHITRTLLNERRLFPALYGKGDYTPITTDQAGMVFFSRTYGEEALIVAASIDPFDNPDVDDVRQSLALDAGWSNLLDRHALMQRKHGGSGLPAAVFRKSK